jgi:hypothetical protein
LSMLTNRIVPDVAKFLCSGCGDILNFIGDPLQQCPGCETSFRVSISTLIGIAAPALQTTVERGRNITISSTNTDEEKPLWMSQLLASILSLLQNQTVLQLESIRPGEHTDCTLLTILRSLSYEQLEELRPDLVLHGECASTHCNRFTHPLIPETVELPQLSQLEIANLRNAWAGFDGIRLALASQGAKLADVTNRLHTEEDNTLEVKKQCL